MAKFSYAELGSLKGGSAHVCYHGVIGKYVQFHLPGIESEDLP